MESKEATTSIRIPVNLGIKKFKQEIKINFPNLTGHQRYKFIAAFKKRSWMEYHSIVRDRGFYPTHRVYGKEVEITTDTEEVKVKVNGK
jgi:hypothetical protein